MYTPGIRWEGVGDWRWGIDSRMRRRVIWSGWYHCHRDSRDYECGPDWDGGRLGDDRARALAAAAAGGHDEERVHMVAHD
jgi:hypothetical protein